MITELVETTDWDIPNNTYYIDEKGKCFAYKHVDADEVLYFKTPMMFDKKYRKFKSKKLKEMPK